MSPLNIAFLTFSHSFDILAEMARNTGRPSLYALVWASRTRRFGIFLVIVTIILAINLYGSSSPTTPPFRSFTERPTAHRCQDALKYKASHNSSTSGTKVVDLLPLQEAQTLCAAHGLEVYSDRSRPRKVYDLFLFNTEFDWLEVRINELFPYVDHFILLESLQTFSGNSKPQYFKENLECLLDLAPEKLIYHGLDMSDRTYGWWKPAWDREEYARNAMFTQVFPSLLPPAKPNHKDVILVSDIDEIPRPETITVLKNCDFPKRTNLRSRFFYYSYQWEHHGKDWEHPQATWYDGAENTILPNDLRWGHKKAEWNYQNASWHCSSCFSTVAEMDYKIASFSHQEFNQEKFRAPSEIVRRVRNGIDLFDRSSEKYDKQVPARDYPEFLKKGENAERFRFMVNRDANNANFLDYP
jgi:beta-1,4-mannosyl-glycoprotein beta-1,4-N-acetylglucosaminyltransferase